MSSTTRSQQHRHRATEQRRQERRQQDREQRRIAIGSMNMTLVGPRDLLISEIGLRKGAHKNRLVQGI